MSAREAPAVCGNTYDEVPYAGYPFPQSHPDRLATMARLAGLEPSPLACCRVLELGCGDAGNLLPMAYNLPGSRFVGIDASGQAIAKGRSLAAEIGLGNIELCVADFMELGPELGQFDYIIAHGVYSWVPAAVRERLLALSRMCLAPHGVAYISYNVYPGFYLRQMMREMMLFHNNGTREPLEFVKEGLELLEFISSAFPTGGEGNHDLYGVLIKEHLELMNSHRHLEQIYHDDLASVDDGVFFHQFVSDAQRHGLQYLSEAVLSDMDDGRFPDEVREALARLSRGDVILREQYLDFLKCRVFRQTLLCRSEVSLNRELDELRLETFYLASTAKPGSGQTDLSSGEVEEFCGLKGGTLRTDHPGAKAALVLLAEAYPIALSWNELLEQICRRLSIDEHELDVRALSEILGAACRRGLIQLRTQRPHFIVEVSEHPLASPLARLQSTKGKSVVNQVHESIHLDDELSRHFLQLLDGSRDRAALTNELFSIASRTNPDVTREKVSAAVERNLNRVARSALLIA